MDLPLIHLKAQVARKMPNAADPLIEFWSHLEGTIHPTDVETFERFPNHGFNLDYPPPAYVGDLRTARIIILQNNGGYRQGVTDREFEDTGSEDRFRLALHKSEPANPEYTAPYYLNRNYSAWLKSGAAALVNGVAYRSIDGKAADVKALTEELPSARFHRNWLIEKMVPELIANERFVVLHRWSRWGDLAKILRGLPNVVQSPAPVSENLTRVEYEAADAFLNR
ncbi:hypothetical protein KUV65_15680 [Maritalea mobilis]|uniref:hypothetical protein n=1 Tax=Maritalea mobilis TaxID=483324 RepID=UPI001C93DA43|nr:hypothetical protein [Maritalea mobilis]MBY6202815.1 hypothetical protein [Maritalea mobilis]